MLRHYFSILFFIFLMTGLATDLAAQNSRKKVTITVTDQFSGKAVEGAEVALQGIVGSGKFQKITNAEGKAFFDLYMVTKTLNAAYKVRYPVDQKLYKIYSGTFRLVDEKDEFEFAASIQPELKKVNFKISDDKRQPLVNVTAKLKDDNGKETMGTSNANGIASLDVSPAAQYKKALLTVSKEGFNDYSIPVEIDSRTSQLSVVASMTVKTNAAEKDVIIVDDSKDPKKDKKDQLPPSETGVNTSMPPGFLYVSKNPSPTWGPFTPACDMNPLASVTSYTPLAVEDEQTLFDNISTSCLGAAGDAVTALVDATENIINIGTKLNAIWTHLFQITDKKQAIPAGQKAHDDTKILVKEESEKTKKAIEEAYEKSKDLLDKMKELTEGPEMYVLKCIWDGFKDYAVPEPLTKLKKSVGAFDKAKKAMEEKLEAIKTRLESGEVLKFSDKALFTDWKDVSENVEKTTSGLNLIASYISNPARVLPYEWQGNLALSTVEKMLGTLMSDCQVREADRQIKKGIAATQAALTAARKKSAQMKKGETKWRQIINDYVNKNFKEEDRGWERYANNDVRKLQLPKEAYNSWVNYHNAAIAADQDSDRLEDLLKKLAGHCNKLQPMAATLNERVNKYEGLYTKGLIALEDCKLDDARNYVKELQGLEKSECGHFYPKPFGKTKSEELDDKIKAALKSGKCKEAGLNPKLAGTWYRCEGGYTIIISGNTASASLIWEQDLSFWEKPNTWRVKNPRVYTVHKVEDNKITGRWESAPEFEEYLPGSEVGKKKVRYSGTFEFKISETNYGPADERISLEGTSTYDSDACRGCVETWCFIRVKKWK